MAFQRASGSDAGRLRSVDGQVQNGIRDPALAEKFYAGMLGLDLLMDMSWICTYGSDETMSVQVSFMSAGGSGTPVPDLSIEVDDLDTVLHKCNEAGLRIEYGPVAEAWGVRRFFVRDPFGRLVNVLVHAAS